jgi:DHA1 family inner membrane transport protein
MSTLEQTVLSTKAMTRRRVGALVALVVGAFATGMTEFVIAGLLPEVGHTFQVSVSTAGLLVSGYAIGVAVGGPVITAVTTRVPRKLLLLLTMLLFIAASVLSAFAPDYGILLAGRVFSAFAQGVFFGVGAVMATQVAKPGKEAAAISLIVAGVGFANVIGIPVGTLIGQLWGWRSTFLVVTAVGILAALAVVLLVPKNLPRQENNVRSELREVGQPRVIGALVLTVFSYGGVAIILTYVAELLTTVSGATAALVPLGLLVFGFGLLVGSPIGGRLADRNLRQALILLSVTLTAALVVLAVVEHNLIGTFVLLLAVGVFGGAILPVGQLNVITRAPQAAGLASALNISAINVGIALGALIGGGTIMLLGAAAIPWVAAGYTAIAGILALVRPRKVARL